MTATCYYISLNATGDYPYQTYNLKEYHTNGCNKETDTNVHQTNQERLKQVIVILTNNSHQQVNNIIMNTVDNSDD